MNTNETLRPRKRTHMLGGQDYDSMDGSPSPQHAGGKRGAGMGLLMLVVALVVAGAWGARQFGGPGAAIAAGPGKPMMLMFTADWCGPCQQLKATVLSHPTVLDRLERKCRFRTIDLTQWTGQTAAVAKHYGVEGVPTLMFIDEKGRELSRYNGSRDPQSFVRWIEQYTK